MNIRVSHIEEGLQIVRKSEGRFNRCATYLYDVDGHAISDNHHGKIFDVGTFHQKFSWVTHRHLGLSEKGEEKVKIS